MPYTKTVAELLTTLRIARFEQTVKHDAASDALYRATKGMGMHRATDRGGTGRCPLTDNALTHAEFEADAQAAKATGDDIWRQLRPLVDALPDLDARMIVTMYHNKAVAWPGVCNAVKRSDRSARILYNAALMWLDGKWKEQANGR